MTDVRWLKLQPLLARNDVGGCILAKKNDTKSELGKFIAVIGAVLGVAAGSIFVLNQFVFDSNKAPTVKTTATQQPAQKISTEAIQTASEGTAGESSSPESSQTQTPPVAIPVSNTASVEAVEPFRASLEMGEYVAIFNQAGTEKVLSFHLTKEEVKTLLGKPKSESYVDGETTNLCYNYGSFSIFFDENDQYISYMSYDGKKDLLSKPWLSKLTKTQDTGNVDFYDSPTGYTMVKVDHYPESNDVVVYLLKNYPQTENVATPPPPEPSQVVQTPAPTPPSKNNTKKEQKNADGSYVMSPGEELLIENVQVTNSSKVHSAKYTIDINYSFAYNSPNMVKVITDPEKNLELMPGETATVQIKVKTSKSAPKASYRFIVSLKQGWASRPLKDFTVEVK